MKEKLVSIIIPAYNVGKYIAQTLDSILAQTYKNIEVIVVDDGATDNTKEIIEKYIKNKSFIKLISQKNKGLAGARNTGLKHAAGEYICIFDSDDIMLPNKIEKQVEFLEEHQECDLAYSNIYHFIDNNPNKTYLWKLPQYSLNAYRNLLLHGNYINPNSVLFRRSVYDKYGGFDESIRSAEDWDYWLKISYNKIKFGYLPDFLTMYRMRDNNLSADRVTMYSTALSVLEKQKKLRQSFYNRFLIGRKLIRWRIGLIFAYLRNGDRHSAYLQARFSNIGMVFYVLLKLFPVKIINYLYKSIQKIRFLERFKSINIK